jgi:signal transduction histidine kinase
MQRTDDVLQPVSRRRPVPPADARLMVLEALVRCEDVSDFALVASECMLRQARAREVLVAIRTSEGASAHLAGVSGYGLEPARVRAVRVDLEERSHPLVRALEAGGPTELCDIGEVDGQPPHPCLALPIPWTDADGLLVVWPPPPAPAELDWVIEALGRHLRRVLELQRLRRAERLLVRERALLTTVLSAVPDPVLLTDAEGRLVLANPRAESYFAAQPDDGEERRRAVALNNMLLSATLSRRAIDAAPELRREVPLADPADGSDRLYELMSTVIPTPDGPCIASVLRNVTDLQLAMFQVEENYRKLRLAESAVRAERDRLELVIDAAVDPIVVSDANGVITRMNPPAERLFTAAENAQPSELRSVQANGAHLSWHVANVFLAAGSRFRAELAITEPKTGHPVPIEAISGRILGERGELTAVVTVLHDRSEAVEKARLCEELERATKELASRVQDATSELVHQNELLRRQQIELEQASSLKSQFLANMSHEFRTPLNAILGYTSMLLQGVQGELSPMQRRNLERVDSNAKHLLAIINDILDISRIEAGRMPVHRSRFELDTLIAEVLAEVDPLIVRSKLEVKRDVALRLPAIRSDRPKVKQILVNLLSNALKFTSEGTVIVSAVVLRCAGEVHVSVADTGIGIAERDKDRIFGDFQQVDASPTRPYGGAGLGLAICKRLADVLGGRLMLASEVGRGSTFTLALPIQPRKR